MKVLFKKTIIEKISDECTKAEEKALEIDRIELDDKESKQLDKELRKWRVLSMHFFRNWSVADYEYDEARINGVRVRFNIRPRDDWAPEER